MNWLEQMIDEFEHDYLSDPGSVVSLDERGERRLAFILIELSYVPQDALLVKQTKQATTFLSKQPCLENMPDYWSVSFTDAERAQTFKHVYDQWSHQKSMSSYVDTLGLSSFFSGAILMMSGGFLLNPVLACSGVATMLSSIPLAVCGRYVDCRLYEKEKHKNLVSLQSHAGYMRFGKDALRLAFRN